VTITAGVGTSSVQGSPVSIPVGASTSTNSFSLNLPNGSSSGNYSASATVGGNAANLNGAVN
jgi:hypothetical protein